MAPGMLLWVFQLISILCWSVGNDLPPDTTDFTLEGLYEGVECKNGTIKYCGNEDARGPHCKDCLLFLWAKIGCNKESKKGPAHNKNSIEFWHNKTVREVNTNMNLYKLPMMATLCHGPAETSTNVDTSTSPVTLDYLSTAVRESAASATYRSILQSTSGEVAHDVSTRYPADITTGTSIEDPVDRTTGSSTGSATDRDPAHRTIGLNTVDTDDRTIGLTTVDPDDKTIGLSTVDPDDRIIELTKVNPDDRTIGLTTVDPDNRTIGLTTVDSDDRTIGLTTVDRTIGLTTVDLDEWTIGLTTVDSDDRTIGLTTVDSDDRTTGLTSLDPDDRTIGLTTMDPTPTTGTHSFTIQTPVRSDPEAITDKLITDTSIEGTLDNTPAVETSETSNRILIPKPEKSTVSSEAVTSNDVAVKTLDSSMSSHVIVTSSIPDQGSSEGPHFSVTSDIPVKGQSGVSHAGMTSEEHFAENGKPKNDQREEQSVGRCNVNDPSVLRGYPETAAQRQRAMSTKAILLVCSLVFLVLVILALGIFLYRLWERRRASSVYNLKRGAPLESKSNGRGPPSKLQVTLVDIENEAKKNEENCSKSELIPIDQLDIYSV